MREAGGCLATVPGVLTRKDEDVQLLLLGIPGERIDDIGFMARPQRIV